MSLVALHPSPVTRAGRGGTVSASEPRFAPGSRSVTRVQHEPVLVLPEVPRAIRHSVEIEPAEIARRRSATWDGMAAEIVQMTRLESFHVRFKAPVHLLVAYGRGMRRDGETCIQGVPRVTLRDLRRKLTFAPAGCEFLEWQEPRALSQITYLYIEPDELPGFITSEKARVSAAPRVLFEDPVLWGTACKLTTLIESADIANRHYLEAVGRVLSHELIRTIAGRAPAEMPIRGGLAAWQQRVVTEYIEEHLAEDIALTALADLARLSPHHFCRAFKHSLGRPPCRYHALRRIERAKVLLATSNISVTEIGLGLGFSETSSFTAAFRRETGLTPTDFRRSLS
ncbi:MAG: helix-turn-helix transcriptional regulator [Acetobacteraceae bacterium]|nr:helix-turn-helix transcriptional regulator [Acetobacteraceae bacterium]